MLVGYMDRIGSRILYDRQCVYWDFIIVLARKRPHKKQGIAVALENGAHNEDGLDFDADNLVDPNLIPKMGSFEDDIAESDIDVDSTLETLEEDNKNPYTSAEIALSHVSLLQLYSALVIHMQQTY